MLHYIVSICFCNVAVEVLHTLLGQRCSGGTGVGERRKGGFHFLCCSARGQTWFRAAGETGAVRDRRFVPCGGVVPCRGGHSDGPEVRPNVPLKPGVRTLGTSFQDSNFIP
jgi:hypothetical protein